MQPAIRAYYNLEELWTVPLKSRSRARAHSAAAPS